MRGMAGRQLEAKARYRYKVKMFCLSEGGERADTDDGAATVSAND